MLEEDLNFSMDAKDDDIVRTVTAWKKESEPYHDELLKYQRVAEQYYLGNQTERGLVPRHNTDTVENRIFEAVETIVPIATSGAHQFLVMPGSADEKAVARADSLNKVLDRKYETLDVQRKLEDVLRHMMLFRFGVLKWGWDQINDDIGIDIIHPQLILVPRLRVDPHDLPYTIEIQEFTKDELEENFPKAQLDDVGFGTETIDTNKQEDRVGGQRKTVQVLEVWTDEMVAWVASNTVLRKEANPYYDFKGDKRKKQDEKGEETKEEELKFYNHFMRPRKPYVFFSTYNVSAEPFGSLSLTESVMSIQDNINVQKRQITDNLRRMGNSQVYIDADSMSEERARNITNEIGLAIYGKGVASENKVRREPGTPLPNAHFSNLQHSELIFDNIVGLHSPTRGKSQARTLGQDILSRQQDLTRIDLITRVLNRGMFKLTNGLVQLMKLFYTQTQTVRILGEEGAIEFVNLNREDIDDKIEIIVKSGNKLPMDEVSLRTEAIQLYQIGAIDPLTLLEILKFPNPDKAVQRLQQFRAGQLVQEAEAKIGEAEATAGIGTGQGGAGATTGAARSVETRTSSLRRATENATNP